MALILACLHIICSVGNRYPWCSPPFFVANVFYALQVLCLKFRQPKHCCILSLNEHLLRKCHSHSQASPCALSLPTLSFFPLLSLFWIPFIFPSHLPSLPPLPSSLLPSSLLPSLPLFLPPFLPPFLPSPPFLLTFPNYLLPLYLLTGNSRCHASEGKADD